MPKFKVGDVVRYKGRSGKALRGDSKLIINAIHGFIYCYIDEKSNKPGTESAKLADVVGGDYEFELVSEQKVKEESMSKSWKFSTIAPAIDIDWHTIGADLSKANPIATISVDGENGPQDYVAIHKTLLEKADNCGLPVEMATRLREYDDMRLNAESFVVYMTERQEYRRIIDWAKMVKEARYPEEYKNKGVVTVSLVKV